LGIGAWVTFGLLRKRDVAGVLSVPFWSARYADGIRLESLPISGNEMMVQAVATAPFGAEVC
jgi:hypothetical protein